MRSRHNTGENNYSIANSCSLLFRRGMFIISKLRFRWPLSLALCFCSSCGEYSKVCFVRRGQTFKEPNWSFILSSFFFFGYFLAVKRCCARRRTRGTNFVAPVRTNIPHQRLPSNDPSVPGYISGPNITRGQRYVQFPNSGQSAEWLTLHCNKRGKWFRPYTADIMGLWSANSMVKLGGWHEIQWTKTISIKV